MQKLTKSTKFDKTNILDHVLTLLDTTTQSIPTFVRENIDFYHFNLELENFRKPTNNTPHIYIFIHNSKIIEFRTLTRLFDV